MRKKTVGYIVEGPRGVYGLSPRPSVENILWLNYVSLFKTRQAAQKALGRTVAYRNKVHPGYWPWLEKSYIRRVTAV